MAKYLNPEVLKELDEYRKRIFADREEIYRKHKIDVLDTDTLSSLSVYEIVSQYDDDYNINFARNGEDAKSNDILIEQKCSRVERRKKSGTYPDALYQFHAMGDLIYPRYILVSRDKTTLALVRLYDISQPKNVKLVQDYLMAQRQAWEDRCAIDKKYMKRDVIGIPESELVNKLKITEQLVINDCTVIRA
jgi:hypothetical protein